MSGEKLSGRPRRLRSTFIAGISIALACSVVIWFLSLPTEAERRVAGTWEIYLVSDGVKSDDFERIRFDLDGRLWSLTDSGEAELEEGMSWAADESTLRLSYGSPASNPWQYLRFVINEYWAGRDGLGPDEQYEIQWRTENEIELTGGTNRATVNPTTLIGIRHEVHPSLVSVSPPASSADASSREKSE